MTWGDFCAQCLPEAHTVTVEAYRGSGPVGDIYDQAQQVQPCFCDDKRKLVRDAQGDQVVSESTVYAPLETTAPAGSRITLPSGRTTTVITAARRTACGWALPEHLEIACQ
ncbi:MAG: hypothetical protein JXA67_20510 [Micromonosporaceae bacterium]|nr:hypothetical protein [Micromonosporaceae bacterium]